jgi:hypothetical protein
MKNLPIRRIGDFKSLETQESSISFEELLLEPALNTTLLRLGGKDYFVEILNILSLKSNFNELSEDEINIHLEKMASWQYTLVSAMAELKYDLKVMKLDYDYWRGNLIEQLRMTSGESKPSNERMNNLLMNKYPDVIKLKLEKIYKLESIVEKTSNIYDILRLRNETLRSVLRSRDFKKGKGSSNAV